MPYFAVVRTVGLYDQPLALIFIYSLFNLPFTIWMLKGFLTEIPREIEEAALAEVWRQGRKLTKRRATHRTQS